ncbi:MAG: hypothetical protein WBM69_00300 [Desulfobacterales bacterium]
MSHTDTTEDQRTKTYAFLNRRCMLKLIWMAALGTIMLISGCDPPKLNSDPKNKTKENKKMESVSVPSDIRPQLPPLDTSQPQGLKTATFALG